MTNEIKSRKRKVKGKCKQLNMSVSKCFPYPNLLWKDAGNDFIWDDHSIKNHKKRKCPYSVTVSDN